MRCPRCKADKDRVVDSRTSADGTDERHDRRLVGYCTDIGAHKGPNPIVQAIAKYDLVCSGETPPAK